MNWAELTLSQLEAVKCVEGPILVSAGAGSGKTKTLTAKIAYLIDKLGFDPSRILAITFTNKAAQEMIDRLEKSTGLSREHFPWIRTFHSACFKILNEEAEKVGYSKPISVYSESQQKSLLKKILLSFNLDAKYLDPILSTISRAKNSGNPEDFLRWSRLPKIIELYHRYNEMLRNNNAVDFDDILLYVRNLLKKDITVRRRYQERFDYILVDEFQDSNRIQNEITELLLRNGNLMVVGDDYQSIYKFRGSDIEYFITFPERFKNAKVIKLEENFRSTDIIVEASQALISRNRVQLEKRCFSRKKGAPIIVANCYDEYDEAEWIARKCMEYKKASIPFSNMAILYRTRFCSLPFEEVFRELKIPYRISGARGFFESKEIQDINAYIISAFNPKDDLAFERIINVPRRGIGDGTIKKIEAFKSSKRSLQEATWEILQAGLLPKKVEKELLKLKDILDNILQMTPSEAIKYVLTATNYLDYLEGYAKDSEDFLNRKENIELLIYIASQSVDLSSFIERMLLVKEDQSDGDEKDVVNLMTVHGAKGLEFDVVFVSGLEEGLFPHWKSTDPFDGNEGALEEERRLLYVAMTRASSYLHLSWARRRRGGINEPSRFFKEIPKKYLTVERILNHDNHYARR